MFPCANYFWSIEGKASAKNSYAHSVIPQGTADLIYIYKGSFRDKSSGQQFRQGDLIISAQKSTPGSYRLEEDFGIFGVCLQAYSLSAFLSVSGIELMDQTILADTFRPLNAFRSGIVNTWNNTERMQLTLQLLKQIGHAIVEYDHHFCQLIDDMSTSNVKGIFDIAANSNVSLRQFQRKFKNLTGYTPAQFLRTIRLQAVLDRFDASNLSRLALESGYYDQSHFINDFKKIAGGITPGKYFEANKEFNWRAKGHHVAFFQS